MPSQADVREWPERIRSRYESYLKTSFFFRDPHLRESFQAALREAGSLMKGPFPEAARAFRQGIAARALASEWFPGRAESLAPALLDLPLYSHQERAIRLLHGEDRNAVVATGTASGKTETFLYPILLHLYRQHLRGELLERGVRALILYPMNALANDQRERLGRICKALEAAGSDFRPTFGQYTGQTPESLRDGFRHGSLREEERLPGELVFREEMRKSPPHILLTNYSMLEYLLIRPDDSPLFDGGIAARWRFLVLDEAHQYRGARGMEMAMLLRRLKQRLREGGRGDDRPFRCIATSATLSTGKAESDRAAIAGFAETLFGEPFGSGNVVFAERKANGSGEPGRYHAFLRALEGAFLVHRNGKDVVRLNRSAESSEEGEAVPLEIALCRECGQHYYVGQVHGGRLKEAVRDPSQTSFGVEFYLPSEDGETLLCRRCGAVGSPNGGTSCDCNATVHVATVHVKKCDSHRVHADQLRRCEACGYSRGGVGDPVQEVVHGSDGPNAVIATALHELLPQERRKVLAFADSRQEAAFFAWYAEDSYRKLRDRNLLYRALTRDVVGSQGLSIDDIASRLQVVWEQAGLFRGSDTREARRRRILTSVLREIVTDERRLSLAGVGLARWMVALPDDLRLPRCLLEAPWNLREGDAAVLLQYCLSLFLERRALELPRRGATLPWSELSSIPRMAFGLGKPGGRRNVTQWGGARSGLVRHLLARTLARTSAGARLEPAQALAAARSAAESTWTAFRSVRSEPFLVRAERDGTFRLKSEWIRLHPARPGQVWACNVCTSLTPHNVCGVCPRNGCLGALDAVVPEALPDNHYRSLYRSGDLPPRLRSEEHTAQVAPNRARRLQEEFKDGAIHLLSSSTTFEVGVSLGDLDAVFLRNVPPEPFNYVQRVGRAGRGDRAGLAVTYCRRNPHDLHHYGDPEKRVIRGVVDPPRLHLSNERIVLRHVAATVLSGFFRENIKRFRTVEAFIGCWNAPRALADFNAWCLEREANLTPTLERIVPPELHEPLGIGNGGWIERVAGEDLHSGDNRLAKAEAEVCSEYLDLQKMQDELYRTRARRKLQRVMGRMDTIAGMPTLNFLSRKAVIPKYGFPVDVVELDTRSGRGRGGAGVVLQRDLSQAIAEYAPGAKVVANKLEWESCGLKRITGKEWPERRYRKDDLRNFKQWLDGAATPEDRVRGAGKGRVGKYLIPSFGFVTPLFETPKPPSRRVRRYYSTRPFFGGFPDHQDPAETTRFGLDVSATVPGTLVVLCEGRGGRGFLVCRTCGAHMVKASRKHRSPLGRSCSGTLARFSLGHEMVTDVVRIVFPRVSDQWGAYSVAYAVVLGAADALDVPQTDLNVTLGRGRAPSDWAIILYDNVPGGAGLVTQIEDDAVLARVLTAARDRVDGGCGCGSSCYGCLRSYRNQFAHRHLDRKAALAVLERAVARMSA